MPSFATVGLRYPVDHRKLWTRDRESLTHALSVSPEYLRSHVDDATIVDYRDWQIPLGRRFRALKIWFVLRHYGLDRLRSFVREEIRLAEMFEDLRS